MSLDPNTIISSMLGGSIAISGSIAVAVLYIRNQNKSEKKRRLNDRIEETYFEQGILQVESALSVYGTGVALALNDIRILMGRCLRPATMDYELLRTQLEAISKRSAVVDMTSKNFSSAVKWLPTLHKFGSPLHVSVLRTLQFYGTVLSDALSLENLRRNIADSSVEEVTRSIGAIAQILNMAQIYLEKRFTDLKDCFWKKDFESYDDFAEIFSEQRYKDFLSAIEQYRKGLDKLVDAMTSQNEEGRKDATLTFSKWLNENMERNLLK